MRYPDCQSADGDCSVCSLSNYNRDCRNNPVNEIAFLRHQANLTQKAFGELLNIPKRTIENWEAGANSPPEYLVKLIENYLKNENYIKMKGLSRMKTIPKEHLDELIRVAGIDFDLIGKEKL